jgi:hypothetical protein
MPVDKPIVKKKSPGRPPRVRAVRVIRVPVNEDLSARFDRARSLWEQDNPAIDSNDAVVGRVLMLKGIEALEREHGVRGPSALTSTQTSTLTSTQTSTQTATTTPSPIPAEAVTKKS